MSTPGTPRAGAGEAYLAITVLFWGTAFPASKPVLDVMSPWTYTLMRIGLGGLLLAAVLFATERNPWLPRRDLARVGALALLGFVYFQSMWSIGLSLTAASKAAIIMATTPIWGTLIGRLGGERTTPLAWVGIPLAFLGVFAIINNSITAITLGGGSTAGDLVFLANAVAFALYTALGRPLLARHGALKTIAWASLLGALVVAPAGLIGAARTDWQAFDAGLWACAIYVSLGPSGVAQVTWYAALGRLGLGQTVVAMFLVPVVALVTAVTLLGEQVSPVQFAGAAMVLAGIWLVRRPARTRP